MNDTGKINKIAILFFLLSFILLGNISYQSLKYEATGSPDAVQNIFFSKLLANTGSLKYYNQYNLKYDTYIFGSRGFKKTKDPNYFTHGSMHGFIIILAALRIVSDKLIYFIVPIFAIITLIFFYKLCNLFLSKQISLIGSGLLLFSASFFFISTTLLSNIPALCFLIVTLYYFLRGFKFGEKKDFILCSIFAGMMMWVRYEFVIFLLPLVIPFLRKKDRSKFRIKDFIVPFILFFIFFIGLWWTNLELYGGLFKFMGSTTSYLGSIKYYGANITTYKILPFLPPFNLGIFFESFLRFVINANPLIFVFFLFSILFLLIYNQERNRIFFNSSFWILLLISIIPIIFYLGNVWAGYREKEYIVATSYSRFLLPTYSMMILLSLFSIKKLNQKILILFMITFLLFNTVIVFNSPASIKDSNLAAKEFVKTQNRILEKIPEVNAVVFTGYYDKYIFPKRITAIYTSFPENEIINKTTELVSKLVKDNIPVYFLNEDSMIYIHTKFKSREYFNAFESKGLKVKQITGSIYKIEK